MPSCRRQRIVRPPRRPSPPPPAPSSSASESAWPVYPTRTAASLSFRPSTLVTWDFSGLTNESPISQRPHLENFKNLVYLIEYLVGKLPDNGGHGHHSCRATSSSPPATPGRRCPAAVQQSQQQHHGNSGHQFQSPNSPINSLNLAQLRRARAIAVDRISRTCFPLSFFLLNVIYWSVFLNSGDDLNFPSQTAGQPWKKKKLLFFILF